MCSNYPVHRFPSNASNNSKHLKTIKTIHTSIALILTSTLALTGCAAWNKYDLRHAKVCALSGLP